MMASRVVGLVAMYFVTETAAESLRGTYCPSTPEAEEEQALARC